MKRIDTSAHVTNEDLNPSSKSENTATPVDWNTENAAFVAAYNELIDAEGVALEEYRLF